jgi:hypothetical protein
MRLIHRFLDRVLTCLIWVSIGSAIWAVIQAPWLSRPPGPFGSPNYLGAFAAIMLFVAWRNTHLVGCAANISAVWLSQSRGAVLAVGAGLLVLLLRQHRFIAIALALAACVTAMVLHPSAGNARLAVWHMGLTLWSQHPIAGWGVQEFAFIADRRLVSLNHFYSTPLDWLVRTGLVGMTAAMWIAVEAWLAADTKLRAAWLVQGLFLSAAWPTTIVLLAVLAAILVRKLIPGDGSIGPRIIHDDKPLADGRAGALRPERGHRGGDVAISRPRLLAHELQLAGGAGLGVQSEEIAQVFVDPADDTGGSRLNGRRGRDRGNDLHSGRTEENAKGENRRG